MSKCAVVGCKTINNASTTAVSFHRVTKNKKFLPLWEKVVKLRSNSKPSKICSLHFQENDFFANRGKRCLKVHAVPSFNVIDGEYSTDDEEENESLSKLRRSTKTSKGKNTANSDSDDNDSDPYLTEHFPMVTCCYGRTKDVGIQTIISTRKEIALQAKVKMIELTLRRRDAKISYLQTVLDVAKKHIKGTDMEYKLCCELEHIAEPTKGNFKEKRESNFEEKRESNFEDKRESNFSNANKTIWIEDEQSSGEEDACMSVEVVHSPNLKT